MSAAFTPWSHETHELSEGISCIVYDAKGRMVADHLDEPTARLIAAAPRLYEILSDALAFMRGDISGTGQRNGIICDAEDVLAEARGEQ